MRKLPSLIPRLGLFEQLFWRIVAILALAMGLLVVVSHASFIDQLFIAWQTDLQQEAEWTALHWSPVETPERLARGWQQTHDVVRLTLLAPDGSTLADSYPQGRRLRLDDDSLRNRLVGRTPIGVPGGSGTLLLTRQGPPVAFGVLAWQMTLAVASILLLSALIFYPMVRGLRRQFGQLRSLAREVADGRFGATLDSTRQRDLAPLVAAFNDMSLRLHDEDQRKRQLIIDVSHELRSPMARLRALGETIARRPEQAAPFLQQLDAEIALMDRLVGDMLDATRFAEGRAALALQRCDLGGWVQDACARQRGRIEAAGVRCELQLAATTLEVEIDAQRLMQALGNLVENALQAVRGQSEASVVLAFEVSGLVWSLQVADNGRGIPPDELPRVFDRFYRVERDRGRATGGVGLGLAICKAIVEGHGGRITMHSTPGQGTQVVMAFG